MRFNQIKIGMLACCCLLAVFVTKHAAAETIVQVSPDPVQIPFSINGENTLEFPEPIRRVLSRPGKKIYDHLKPMGKFFFIHVPDEMKKLVKMKPEPFSLTFITTKRIQEVIFLPTPSPSQKIRFVTKRDMGDEVDINEGAMAWVNTPLDSMVRRIVIGLANGENEKGYRMREASSNPDVFIKNKGLEGLYYEPTQYTSDYRLDLKRVMYNGKVVGRMYVISNTTNDYIRLNEQMFWSEGCVGVALETHTLAPRNVVTERTGEYKTYLWIISLRDKAPLLRDTKSVRRGR